MNKEQKLQKKREYYQKHRSRILLQMKEKQQEKLKNPEYKYKYLTKLRKYNKDNYEARLLTTIKYKCKKKNIPFNLELSDIVIPTHCPKTGIPLVIHTETGKFMDTPSVDRINPKLGYTKDNIQIVSFWYNVAKLSWDEDMFLNMCKKVVEHHGYILTP